MSKMTGGTAITCCLAVLSISGCSTYSLEKLRHTKPQGNQFQNALARLYMDFSASEEKDYDWQDSWYFADKGLRSVYGKETAPEELGSWSLPKHELSVMKKNRDDLMAVLTPAVIEKKPETAARAQFYFDCWVEQQEENWQKDDIAFCRDSFTQAMAKLSGSDKKIGVKKLKKMQGKIVPVVKEISKKKVSVNKKPVDKEYKKTDITPAILSFVLFFEQNSNAITPESDITINRVADSLVGKDGYVVVIIDKSKNSKDSSGLPFERMQAVKDRLSGLGVKEGAINMTAEKQIDNKINRKVEIFIND